MAKEIKFDVDVRSKMKEGADALADAVSCARSASSARAMNAMFDEDKAMAPIREDFRKRGKKKR